MWVLLISGECFKVQALNLRISSKDSAYLHSNIPWLNGIEIFFCKVWDSVLKSRMQGRPLNLQPDVAYCKT